MLRAESPATGRHAFLGMIFLAVFMPDRMSQVLQFATSASAVPVATLLPHRACSGIHTANF